MGLAGGEGGSLVACNFEIDTVVLLIDDRQITVWFWSRTAVNIYRKIVDDSKPVLKSCRSAVKKAVLEPAAARRQSRIPEDLPLPAKITGDQPCNRHSRCRAVQDGLLQPPELAGQVPLWKAV